MTDPGSQPAPPPSLQAALSAAPPEATGHPVVDEVTAFLAELDGLPVDQHVAVFESAHDRLRAVLASGGAPTASTG